jgi:hypothetical protein
MNPLSNLFRALANGILALSPSCKEASRLQSEALDHPLSLSKRLGLKFHLLLCKWCRRYGKQIEFLHTAAKQLPEQDSKSQSPTLSPEARDRIRRRIQSEKN